MQKLKRHVRSLAGPKQSKRSTSEDKAEGTGAGQTCWQRADYEGDGKVFGLDSTSVKWFYIVSFSLW